MKKLNQLIVLVSLLQTAIIFYKATAATTNYIKQNESEIKIYNKKIKYYENIILNSAQQIVDKLHKIPDNSEIDFLANVTIPNAIEQIRMYNQFLEEVQQQQEKMIRHNIPNKQIDKEKYQTLMNKKK